MHGRGALGAVAMVLLAACAQDHTVTGLAAERTPSLTSSPAAGTDAPGAVYALTNQAGGNAVAMYARAANGSLSWIGAVPTGGTGTGASLGSQGALALSDDGRWLFAVNAGSNDVSAFRITSSGLSLANRVASGGVGPSSVTVHGNLLYVLNAGGAGNISGFSIGADGALTPLSGSTPALSGAGGGPAPGSFRPKRGWPGRD